MERVLRSDLVKLVIVIAMIVTAMIAVGFSGIGVDSRPRTVTSLIPPRTVVIH